MLIIVANILFGKNKDGGHGSRKEGQGWPMRRWTWNFEDTLGMTNRKKKKSKINERRIKKSNDISVREGRMEYTRVPATKAE